MLVISHFLVVDNFLFLLLIIIPYWICIIKVKHFSNTYAYYMVLGR